MNSIDLGQKPYKPKDLSMNKVETNLVWISFKPVPS